MVREIITLSGFFFLGYCMATDFRVVDKIFNWFFETCRRIRRGA